MISRNRKWELLENSLHMLESNGWHSIVQVFIVFCSECLKQKTIVTKGYWWWLHFFYHRGCLVPGVKNFGFWGVTSDVSWDVRRGVRILIKKLIT
jgi:hypothetical protein